MIFMASGYYGWGGRVIGILCFHESSKWPCLSKLRYYWVIFEVLEKEEEENIGDGRERVIGYTVIALIEYLFAIIDFDGL